MIKEGSEKRYSAPAELNEKKNSVDVRQYAVRCASLTMIARDRDRSGGRGTHQEGYCQGVSFPQIVSEAGAYRNGFDLNVAALAKSLTQLASARNSPTSLRGLLTPSM